MRVIDGTNAVLGRLAVYAAKLAMKGEEVAVVNCNEIIITGNKKDILAKSAERKTKVGSGQQGPKHSRDIEKIVKRSIRGMLPRARIKGRGKEAYERIKCYAKVPAELENVEKENIAKGSKMKSNKLGELFK